MNIYRIITATFMALFLVSCDIDGDGYIFKSSPNTHIADENIRNEFKTELENSNIEFSTKLMDGGKEFVFWSKAVDSQVQAIKESVVGNIPPRGRSISISPEKRLHPIAESFEKAGIPFRWERYYGQLYLVWSPEHTEKVVSLNDGEYSRLIIGG